MMADMRARPLAAAVAATVLIRLLFAAAVALWTPSLAGFHALDTSSYLLPAQGLAHHLSFSVDGLPDIYRTPGYSLLLVPGIWLGTVEAWAVLLNLAFAAGTALGIHRLARSLFDTPRAGLIGAWLYAIDPLSVFHVAQVTSETAFTFLLVASLAFLLRGLQAGPPESRYLAAGGATRLVLTGVAGFLLAAATLVRPISLYLPWMLALLLAVAWLAGSPRRPRALLSVALFLLLSAGPVLAWQARNLLVTGYGGLSAVVDVNAWYFQAAAVKARLEGKSMMEVRMALGYEEELRLLAHPRERTVDLAVHFRALGVKASEVLRSHPWTYAKIHIADLLKVLTNPGASGYLVVWNRHAEMQAVAGVYPEGGALQAARDFRKMRPSFLAVNAAFGLLLAAFYLAALRGLVRLPRPYSLGLAALTLACLYLLAASGGANSVSRFRHPLMPILCLFAGAGLVRVARSDPGSTAPVASGR